MKTQSTRSELDVLGYTEDIYVSTLCFPSARVQGKGAKRTIYELFRLSLDREVLVLATIIKELINILMFLVSCFQDCLISI